MKILLADKNHEILEEILVENNFEIDKFWNLSADELINILPNYDGLVIRSKFKLTKEILSVCPKLKVIGRVGAGMENIDVEFAKSKNILCLSAPQGNRNAVGEHALGMLLMLMNNLKKADAEVRNGIWLRAENRGFELEGKTVAIIGYGQMGTSFAEKLSGFNCNIIAYDKYKQNFGTNKVKEVTLETIYNEADVVSLHLPLTNETNYYADASFFNAFKKPIYFINTARGKCLNTKALVNALIENKVLGACLDVLEYESISFEKINFETLPDDFKYLLSSNKVILTPHIAGWTHESNYKMSKIIADDIVKSFTNLK
ncbi:MAG: NAD(P)-dependent oxidoreductase [Bacteroidia bacterium]